MDERGQVTPLLAGVVVMTLLGLVLLARIGGMVIDRTRASAAADAAALAGARGGDAAAERVARANGARVVRVSRVGTEFEVTVRLGRAQATARAAPGAPCPATGPRPGCDGRREPGPRSRVAQRGPGTLRSMLSTAGL